MKDLLVCIILFNPSKKDLLNIKQMQEWGLDIVVYDNSLANEGISKRYNQALKAASDKNKKLLLLLDQDSIFDKYVFNKYLECINRNYSNDVIIYYPVLKKKFNINCNFKDNCIGISSGSVINVELALKIGAFDENLFIDEVDHEFALRALNNNLKLLTFNNIYLKHNLGDKRNFYGIVYNCYRIERYYYMMRNYLYIFEKYKKSNNHTIKMFVKKRRVYLLKFFLKSLLFCNSRIAILKLLIKGWYDYKKKIFGKRVLIE